jgi:hypothetical protein
MGDIRYVKKAAIKKGIKIAFIEYKNKHTPKKHITPMAKILFLELSVI